MVREGKETNHVAPRRSRRNKGQKTGGDTNVTKEAGGEARSNGGTKRNGMSNTSPRGNNRTARKPLGDVTNLQKKGSMNNNKKKSKNVGKETKIPLTVRKQKQASVSNFQHSKQQGKV